MKLKCTSLLRNNDNPEPSIILNQSNDNYYGDKIYLKGMISNLSNKNLNWEVIRPCKCDGTTIPVEQGEFMKRYFPIKTVNHLYPP